MSSAARKQNGNRPELSPAQADAVRDQVERILTDPLFRDTTRMKRFLRYVTEETLAGRGHRLKGYTIGLEVFDKPPEFDSQTDTIVRVQAGQLRRRLDLYYSGSGMGDIIRLTIPKGRYAPRFEVRKPALVETVNDQSGSADDVVKAESEAKGPPSIAVVTFEDQTTSDGHNFFAEGLTTEIVSALVQFRHIRVLTLRAKPSSTDTVELSKMLGHKHDVEFVLTGSVRRAGDIFRVVVNLVATETGHILYTQSFDREYLPDRLFELEESIASNVAAAVAAPFGQINRHNRRLYDGRRQSMTAYEAVLRFYEMGLSPTQSDAKALLIDITKITDEHPDFSTGFAIRAMLNTYLCAQCLPAADPDIHLSRALTLSERATRIDPQNGMAYFARFQALYHSGDVEEAKSMAQRAMALNPNDYAMLAYLAHTEAISGNRESANVYEESARALVANPPLWFDSARYVMKFHTGEDATIVEGIGDLEDGMSIVFPMLKLSSSGHLGDRSSLSEDLNTLPVEPENFIAEAIRMLKFWHVKADILDRLVSGWEKLDLNMR